MTNARDNPFATERVETLLTFEPEWIGESWEAIDARAGQLGLRGAVVGPHGSGKTTFLEAFARRLRERGERVVTLFVNRQRRSIDPDFFTTLTERSIILFDGAEQLGTLAWRRFLRRSRIARGLIITAHRPGRLPTMLETRVDPALLKRCIETLAPDFATAPGDSLFRRHAGNLREALLECYDLVGSGR